MQGLPATRVRDTTTLSSEQRERLRREGRIARALEAQRRSRGRVSRIDPALTAEERASAGRVGLTARSSRR
jgi:hypothetical protein